MKSSNAERELIKALKEQGFKYKGIDNIFSSKKYLEPVEVDLILKFLPKIYKEELGAGAHLVHVLKGSREAFDPSPLIKLYEESDLNSVVKSSIGFVIVLSKTGDISKWIRRRLLRKVVTFEDGALVSGLPERGSFKNRGELKEFLELIFEKYPISVLDLYDKIGDKDDVDFLLEQIKKADKKLSKEIEKTLKKILKREGITKK